MPQSCECHFSAPRPYCRRAQVKLRSFKEAGNPDASCIVLDFPMQYPEGRLIHKNRFLLKNNVLKKTQEETQLPGRAAQQLSKMQ